MLTDKKRNLIATINESFHKLNGNPLPHPPEIHDIYEWFDKEAPYSILAHNTDTDPHFIYANQFALYCFKYTETEMLALPSRLSAGEQSRTERQRLLDEVSKNGIAYNYSGPRVDKYGKTFNIYDGIVWQLNTGDHIMGQGALFWDHEGQKPEWYKGINKEK